MTDTSQRPNRAFWIIVALALLPRLILALSLPADDTVFIDRPYQEYARNFAEGNGFWMPNPYSEEVNIDKVLAFRPPLFPFFWGCVYRITNGAYAPIRITFALLSSFTCGVAFLAGLRLVKNRRAAFIGGLACALYPPLIWHSVHMMTEPFFIFFSTTTFWALMKFADSKTIRNIIIAGILAALATLSRSVLVAFLPVMAIWIWWTGGFKAKAFLHAVVFTIVVTAVMSPWIIRNAIRLHAFVPTTTDAGHGFYVANNENTLADPRGFWIPDDWSKIIPPGTNEVDASKLLMSTSAKYLLKNPGTAARLMARRFVTLWRFYPNPEFVGKTKSLVYALSYLPVFPLILTGLWLAHRRKDAAMVNLVLIDMLVGYTTLMSVVFLAMMRYRVPLMPFLLMFAGVAGCWIWEKAFGRRIANGE